jgi:hypothetical protein
MMKRKRWLWGLTALPVVCLPLIAGESQQQAPPPAQSPEQAPPQAPAAAPPTTAESNGDAPEPAAPPPTVPEDERLSADNTLSFPVDI